MTLRVLYFAGLREALGCSTEAVDLPSEGLTVAGLRARLAARGAHWTTLATTKNLRAAVNQTMTGMDASLNDGDEVAFFPPVTGG